MLPPGVEMPAGIVVAPGAEIPAGWTLGDPMPPGAIAPGTAPPGVEESGAAPPTYTEIWSPGPVATAPITAPGEKTVEITSTSQDGYVVNTGSNWHTTWIATSGVAASTTDPSKDYGTGYTKYGLATYTIARGFFPFSLAGISGTVQSAVLQLYGQKDGSPKIILCAGTQADPLTTDDYERFETTEFALVTWSGSLVNTFTLNADGIDHVQDNLAGTVRFCTREYDHDYSNSPQPVGLNEAGARYSEYSVVAQKPKLTIVYK